MAAVLALPIPSTPVPERRTRYSGNPRSTVQAMPRRAPDALAWALAAVVFLGAVLLATMSPWNEASAAARAEEHVVVAGETMWSIARAHAPAGEAALYVEELVALNGAAQVEPGQVVLIP